jgi:hypothetical protein
MFMTRSRNRGSPRKFDQRKDWNFSYSVGDSRALCNGVSKQRSNEEAVWITLHCSWKPATNQLRKQEGPKVSPFDVASTSYPIDKGLYRTLDAQ